jgi:hypothetical protein
VLERGPAVSPEPKVRPSAEVLKWGRGWTRERAFGVVGRWGFLRHWRARRAVGRRKSAAVAVHTTACGWLCGCGSVSSLNSTSCWWLFWVEVLHSLLRWCARRTVGRCKSAAVAVHTTACGWLCGRSSVSSLNSTSCWFLFWDEVFLFLFRWRARRAVGRRKSAAVAVHTTACR